MIIRELQPIDFTSWLPLWEGYNTFYNRKLSDEVIKNSWNRFLNPTEPMFALVAEKDGKLLGLAHYLFHRNTAMINVYLQTHESNQTAKSLYNKVSDYSGFVVYRKMIN